MFPQIRFVATAVFRPYKPHRTTQIIADPTISFKGIPGTPDEGRVRYPRALGRASTANPSTRSPLSTLVTTKVPPTRVPRRRSHCEARDCDDRTVDVPYADVRFIHNIFPPGSAEERHPLVHRTTPRSSSVHPPPSDSSSRKVVSTSESML